MRAFVAAACRWAPRCLHEPRLWPEYHDRYYGGFVRDTDGNNVEAVCHRGDGVTAAEDAREALRLAREALALAEAAARGAGVEVAPPREVTAERINLVGHASAIEFVDRPASSLAEATLDGHLGMEPGEGPASRMRLAKEIDGSVGLTFNDQEGRPRLRLGLDADGKPSVELLGPNGGPAGGMV